MMVLQRWFSNAYELDSVLRKYRRVRQPDGPRFCVAQLAPLYLFQYLRVIL
jgi:hypothetical protein